MKRHRRSILKGPLFKYDNARALKAIGDAEAAYSKMPKHAAFSTMTASKCSATDTPGFAFARARPAGAGETVLVLGASGGVGQAARAASALNGCPRARWHWSAAARRGSLTPAPIS